MSLPAMIYSSVAIVQVTLSGVKLFKNSWSIFLVVSWANEADVKNKDNNKLYAESFTPPQRFSK